MVGAVGVGDVNLAPSDSKVRNPQSNPGRFTAGDLLVRGYGRGRSLVAFDCGGEPVRLHESVEEDDLRGDLRRRTRRGWIRR